jgi:hypothetical protein
MTDHQFLRSIVKSSVAAFMPGVSGPFGNSGSRSEEIPVSKIVAAPPPAGPAEASQSCRLVSTHDTNSERSIMPFEIKNRQIATCVMMVPPNNMPHCRRSSSSIGNAPSANWPGRQRDRTEGDAP